MIERNRKDLYENDLGPQRLAARFPDSESARHACEEIQEFLRSHLVQLIKTPLSSRNPDNPTKTLLKYAKKFELKFKAIYWEKSFLERLVHDSTKFFVWDRILTINNYQPIEFLQLDEILMALGGKIISNSYGVLSLVIQFKVPETDTGKQLKQELQHYYLKSISTKYSYPYFPAPWQKRHFSWGNREETTFVFDGETILLQHSTNPNDINRLIKYLKKHEVEHFRLWLCDDELELNLFKLSLVHSCPECRSNNLRFLLGEVEHLTEDQIICENCGGMYPIKAYAALSTAKTIAYENLTSLSLLGKQLFILNSSGRVYRSNPEGEIKKLPKSFRSTCSIFSISPKTLVVIREGGMLSISRDRGNTWKSYNTPNNIDLHHVTRGPEGEILIATEEGIYLFNLEMADWKKVADYEKGRKNQNTYCLFPLNKHIIYGASRNGTLLKSIDGGHQWKILNTNLHYNIYALVMLNENDGVAMIKSSELISTNNGGKDWTAQTYEGPGRITALAAWNENSIYAVTNSGLIIFSVDKGKTWETHSYQAPYSLNALLISPEGLLYAVGDSGLLIQLKLDTPPEAK